MIDITRLTIKAGDTVQCKPLHADLLTHSPGYAENRIFVVDHFVINGKNQLLYDSSGQYVYSTEVIIYDKKVEVPLTPAEKNKLSLERILEVVFPGEWWINGAREIIVHFKEIDIKNSRDEHHTIRDLYASIPINDQYTINSSNISGMRATLTESELSRGYRHSHLGSSTYFTGYSSFCTGGDMIAELGTLLRYKNVYQNEDMYENYFETLKTYVAWESIEGGPYMSIRNITTDVGPNFQQSNSSLTISLAKVITSYLNKYGIEISITFNWHRVQFSIYHRVVQIKSNFLKVKRLFK